MILIVDLEESAWLLKTVIKSFKKHEQGCIWNKPSLKNKKISQKCTHVHIIIYPQTCKKYSHVYILRCTQTIMKVLKKYTKENSPGSIRLEKSSLNIQTLSCFRFHPRTASSWLLKNGHSQRPAHLANDLFILQAQSGPGENNRTPSTPKEASNSWSCKIPWPKAIQSPPSCQLTSLVKPLPPTDPTIRTSLFTDPFQQSAFSFPKPL